MQSDTPTSPHCWGLMTGKTIVVVGPGELIVGRGPDADVQVDDPSVSRRHLRLALMDDRFSLVDLASENGTRVNGTPVTMTMLESGDAIQIGCDTMIYLARLPQPRRG